MMVEARTYECYLNILFCSNIIVLTSNPTSQLFSLWINGSNFLEQRIMQQGSLMDRKRSEFLFFAPYSLDFLLIYGLDIFIPI